MEFADNNQRKRYGEACEELAEATSDSDKMEALSSLLVFTPDPTVLLGYADQLEVLARQTESQEELMEALESRMEAFRTLARTKGDWAPAREAAHNYIRELTRQEPKSSDLLEAKTALVSIEIESGSLAAAESALADCERLVATPDYRARRHTKLAENTDVELVLLANLELAEARGETEKAILLRKELETLEQRIQADLGSPKGTTKRGALVTVGLVAAGIIWLIYQSSSRA